MYHLCVEATSHVHIAAIVMVAIYTCHEKHFASHGTSWVFSRPLDRKKTQFLTRHWPLCLFWTSALLNRFHWFRIKQILTEIPSSSVHDTKKNKYPNFVFTITIFITTKTNNKRTPPASPQPCFSSTSTTACTASSPSFLRWLTVFWAMALPLSRILLASWIFLQNTYIFLWKKKTTTKKKQKHMWRAGSSCYHPKGILAKYMLKNVRHVLKNGCETFKKISNYIAGWRSTPKIAYLLFIFSRKHAPHLCCSLKLITIST